MELVPSVFIFIGHYILTLLIGKAIYGWYAEIPKRNSYVETQIRLLMHIASTNAVDKD